MAQPEVLEWVKAYIAEVENGHSGKTLQLVNAVMVHTPGVAMSDKVPGLRKLLVQLEQERTPVARNRLLRQWLLCQQDILPEFWAELAFPMPLGCSGGRLPLSRVGGQHQEPQLASRVKSEMAATTESALQQTRRSPGLTFADDTGHPKATSSARPSVIGAVVFDFDCTLTTKHVSPFEDLINPDAVASKIFGGALRVGVMKDTFYQLAHKGLANAVVSRNSHFVVEKVLTTLQCTDRFVDRRLICGMEDYSGEVPKSSVVREHIAPLLGIPLSAILFVDDDPSNIADVQENCPGTSVLLSDRRGLSERQFEEVLSWGEDLVARYMSPVQTPERPV